MTRETKYRAWDKKKKLMFEVYTLSFSGTLSPVAIGSKGARRGEYNLSGVGSILMQYTGLKDKNGKEIYEGDILAPSPKSHEDLRCEVVWDNDWVSFKGLKDNKKDGEYVLTSGNSRKHWEVIGNIYENKELFKGGSDD